MNQTKVLISVICESVLFFAEQQKLNKHKRGKKYLKKNWQGLTGNRHGNTIYVKNQQKLDFEVNNALRCQGITRLRTGITLS